MQIAGSQCAVCGQNIGLMREGTGCIDCGFIAHTSCISDQRCPKCGKPLQSSKEIHATPINTKSDKGTHFWTVAMLVAGLVGYNVILVPLLPRSPTGGVNVWQSVGAGIVTGFAVLVGRTLDRYLGATRRK